MRLLLDTHAFIWWLSGDPRLSAPARGAIADEATSCFVSAASGWEIATKYRLGRLPGVEPLMSDFAGTLAANEFDALPIGLEDALRAGSLPEPSRDPFDRMLIAQALEHDLALASNEAPFDVYGLDRLW